jgi:putative copper resistance protein D
MLSLTVVAARLAQFVSAMVLFGSPLFFVYGLPAEGPGAATGLPWPRRFLLGAAVLLAVATVVSLCAQTAVMSDSIADAFRPDALAGVLTGTQFGLGTAVRLTLAVLVVAVLVVGRLSRPLWIVLAALGAGAAASFAWTGHGAIDDGVAGWAHLVGDILHLLAAAVWLGALAVLTILLLQARGAWRRETPEVLHRALAGFSGVGSGIVAVLLATGLLNSWFLIGPSHIAEIGRTAYGLLVLAKMALFAAMLALAAANRFRLTPRLGAALEGDPDASDGAVAALRRSVLLETSIGAVVLLLVAVLGTLAPLSNQ